MKRTVLYVFVSIGSLFMNLSAHAKSKSRHIRKLAGRTHIHHAKRTPHLQNGLLADQVRMSEEKFRLDSIISSKPNIGTESEDDLYPALGLYNNNWNTNLVNPYKNDDLPESFVIDVSAWSMPCMGAVTSNFGYRPSMHRYHYGTDFQVYVGEPIHAAFDGKVRVVASQPGGFGNVIVIRHKNGLETVYGHLSRQIVKMGQYVKAGEVIGLGGNTGHSTGPHLHFETRILGIAINPAEIFDFQNKVTHMDTYVFYADAGKMTTGKALKNVPGIAYHKVTSGETLFSIAQKYGTSIDVLCQLNKIKNGVIRSGQIIRTA